MKKHHCTALKNTLPFLGFSILAGFFSAVAGIAFKLGAEGAIHLSAAIYGSVRQQPVWIPVLVLGTAGLGLLASLVVSRAQSCKGGGIPASAAAVRGIVSFNWLSSVFVLPFSALLTFLGGLPLGTEGPCVQMGTAIGDGVVRCFGAKKHQSWRRYIMTGGASAGFSIATACPVSAILFSVEELHKKFSPLLLTGVSVSVISAQLTAQLFTLLGVESGGLFHLPAIGTLPAKLLYVPLLVGTVCGLGSVLFTHCYHTVEKAVRAVLRKLSVKAVFPLLFACVSVVGLCLSDTLGTGHALVDKLFQTHCVWYLLLLVFLIRGIFMMAANTAGVTGGLFLPTLAFGAILGSLCAEGLIAVGLMETQDYLLTVILGITAFLGATSRIPLTACVFAVEAMSGGSNVLAVVMAATVAFLVARLSGIEDFTDAVIKAKEYSARKDTELTELVTSVTVSEASFVAGMEPHDILWPNACTVVSVERAHKGHGSEELSPGDVITVHYKTYNAAATATELNMLLGDPAEQDRSAQRTGAQV